MTYVNMCRVLAQVWSFASKMVLSYIDIVILLKSVVFMDKLTQSITSTQDNECYTVQYSRHHNMQIAIVLYHNTCRLSYVMCFDMC
jgi:hypothetical protein